MCGFKGFWCFAVSLAVSLVVSPLSVTLCNTMC